MLSIGFRFANKRPLQVSPYAGLHTRAYAPQGSVSTNHYLRNWRCKASSECRHHISSGNHGRRERKKTPVFSATYCVRKSVLELRASGAWGGPLVFLFLCAVRDVDDFPNLFACGESCPLWASGQSPDHGRFAAQTVGIARRRPSPMVAAAAATLRTSSMPPNTLLLVADGGFIFELAAWNATIHRVRVEADDAVPPATVGSLLRTNPVVLSI